MNPPVPPSPLRSGRGTRDQDPYPYLPISDLFWTPLSPSTVDMESFWPCWANEAVEETQRKQPIVIHVLDLCGPLLPAHK